MRQITATAVSILLVTLPISTRAATAEPWAETPQFKVIINTIKAQPIGEAPKAPKEEASPCASAQAGAADAEAPECAASGLDLKCGLFGTGCPGEISSILAEFDDTPVNTGFNALGGAGTTGEVDGPFSKGNGTYEVHRNTPYYVSMWIKTGYVEGTVTISRDKKAGKDRLNFKGRYWDQGKGDWGSPVDGGNDVVITYNAKTDQGKISWVENGTTKSEGYWGGAKGKDMTIELAGGWNHDFEQD